MSPVDDIEGDFPGLIDSDWAITSSETPNYNCIAWAAGDDTRWWWPSEVGGFYWPAGLSREVTLENFVTAFRRQGYRECDSGEYEAGFEKIAIYANEAGRPTHAARQLPEGTWTSKLGETEDIMHSTPDGVSGDTGPAYGEVAQFMRRRAGVARPDPGATDDLFSRPGRRP